MNCYINKIILIIAVFFSIETTYAAPGHPQKRTQVIEKLNELNNKLHEVKSASKSLIKGKSISDSSNFAMDSLRSEIIDSLSNEVNILKMLDEVEVSTDRQSFKLSIAILIFGLSIVLAVIISLFFRGQVIGFTSMKLISVVIIATSSIYLITAGFDDKQITPVVGLLGTLAGYLLGANNSDKPNPSSNNQPPTITSAGDKK